MSVYGEVLLNRRKATVRSYTQFWTYIYNSNFNPLDGNPPGAAGSFIDVKYRRFVAGLRGDVGKSWNWDISFQHSHSDGNYTSDQIFNDAVTPSKTPGTCVGTLTAVRRIPCIDVPWLDPQILAGNITSDAAKFLFGTETGNSAYTQ